MAVLPLMLMLAFALGEDPSAVQDLDAGEIAEIDDGNFVDLFDDNDADSVSVEHDSSHMGSGDMKTALDTWEVLYGSDHPSKLGASKEDATEAEPAEEAEEANPKLEAKKEEAKKVTDQLLKATSAKETGALEVKLGQLKDQVKEIEDADETPEQAQANLQKQIQKEVARARNAKSEARKTLLAAKDGATTEQAQKQMKDAQKTIDKESKKLAQAQADGDEQAAKASFDVIKAKNQEINQASSATLISHEHKALVDSAEAAMSKFLDKPKVFAKISDTKPTLVEVKPEAPGADNAAKEEVVEKAKVEEAAASAQQSNAEEKLSNATTPEAKTAAKEELKAADDKIVAAKVKEAAAEAAEDDTASEVAKTAAPGDQVQLVAPLQALAKKAAINAKEKQEKATEAAAYAKKTAEKSAEVAKKHAEKIKEKEAKKVEQVKKMALKAKKSAESVVEKAEVMEEKAGNPKAVEQEEKKEEEEKEDEAKQEIEEAEEKKHDAVSKKLEAEDEKKEAQDDLKKAVTQGQIDRAKAVIQEQGEKERVAQR